MSYVRRSEVAPAWLPELPADWEREWLKWSVTLRRQKATLQEREDLPYISNEAIESWTGRLRSSPEQESESEGNTFSTDDVLFNKLRPYLAKVYRAEFDGISSGELLCLQCSTDVQPQFLQYVLLSKGFIDEVDSETFGSKMPRADWEIVGHQPLPKPSLEVQRKITRFLDEKTARIDALIEKKRALLDRLAEKRQALITRAVTKGLNPDAPMKPSGIEWLGEVPAHWEVWPIKRYLTENRYGISEALSDGGDVAILRMGNIQNLAIDLTDLKFVDEVASPLLLRENDVLFNRTNSIDLVGKSGIYKGAYAGALSFASYLARFRFDARYLPEFANFVFGTDQLLEYARTMAYRAIGQANLNPTRFAQIAIPAPSVDEQRAIIDFLAPRLGRIEFVTSEVVASMEKLAEYRSALITAAVTGQIPSLN